MQSKDSLRIFMVNGIKIAMLAYSEHTNGVPIPKGKSYLINLIDEAVISKIFREQGKKERIWFWYIFHYGEEYKREPNGYQQYVGLDKTVDLVQILLLAGIHTLYDHLIILKPILQI